MDLQCQEYTVFTVFVGAYKVTSNLIITWLADNIPGFHNNSLTYILFWDKTAHTLQIYQSFPNCQ